MKIYILTDNAPSTSTAAEHGLSYLVEHDGRRILFDTGQSDLFLVNASKMGVEISNVDAIVLSHGHYDHGNGLKFLKGGRLVCHPGCFVKRYSKRGSRYIGLKNTLSEISDKYELTTSIEPYQISQKIIFLGEIPRNSSFESKQTGFIYEDGKPDYIIDDSAIALILKEGIFVVTGCGHAGIVNTMEHAKRVSGVDRIYGIIGGFHLKEDNLQTRETIKYLKDNEAKYVYPSHCTALPALAAFNRTFGIDVVRTGQVFEL